MTHRVLVTGASGFVGQWLCRLLTEQGHTVYAGTIDNPPPAGILSEPILASIRWLPLDVTSDADITRALGKSEPDRVFHLAGIASLPDANAAPVRTFEVNALGVLRLLSHVVASRLGRPRVLVVGSAEQYGAQPPPLDETNPMRPLTPYAAAKASQETIALQVFRSTGLPVVCTRSFNHSGVGHGATYLLPSLVRRALDAKATGGKLSLGSHSLVRDYLHVADVVRAYAMLLESGTPGEVYNVCSGTGVTVKELAERVLKRVGHSTDISTDPALVRPIDIPTLVGDNAKLRRVTGWKPERTIDDIIDDLIHAATS